MKKSLLFALVVAQFTLGAVLAFSIGANPIIGGGTALVIGVVVGATSPSGSLTATVGFDLAALNTALGAYCRKYEPEIMRGIFNAIQLENYTRKVTGVTHQYAITSSIAQEMLQPFQHAFTPKGEVEFTAMINTVNQIKIDYQISEIDALYQSYLCFLADEKKERKDWPFVMWLVSKEIMPKMIEEMDYNSYNGVYAAPTPGTAGASVASVTGFKKVIEDAVDDDVITPIVTGEITATNIVDKVEQFVDDLPTKYQNLNAPILMSMSNARKYWRDYRNNFGGNGNYDGKNNLKVDATGKEVIGIAAMEGSDRFVHTPKANMLTMFDSIEYPTKLQTQQDIRVIKLFGDFKRGYGFGDARLVFVNDQE